MRLRRHRRIFNEIFQRRRFSEKTLIQSGNQIRNLLNLFVFTFHRTPRRRLLCALALKFFLTFILAEL